MKDTKPNKKQRYFFLQSASQCTSSGKDSSNFNSSSYLSCVMAFHTSPRAALILVSLLQALPLVSPSDHTAIQQAYLPLKIPPINGRPATGLPPFFFLPPIPSDSVMLPSPKPLRSLSMPRPPSRPVTRPPSPRPLSSLPTRFSTPASSKPTAAMIWKSGSVSRAQSGFSFFFACGMSEMRFFALSMVVTTVVVSSFRQSARRYSSGVASRVLARPLACAAMRPSGSRPRRAPLHSWRMRPPSSMRGLTLLTSSSSSSSSRGVRSAFSIYCKLCQYLLVNLEWVVIQNLPR